MINFENDLHDYLNYTLSSQNLKERYQIIKTIPSDKQLSERTTYELLNIFLIYFSRFPRGKHNVVISPEMKSNELFLRFKKQITSVVKSIETDNGLNLYLPKNIGNVIYCDELLSDWGVSHFHIMPITERNGNLDDKYIIYGIFDSETVLFIDIQDHKHFLEKRLLEIVDKYNPEYLFKLNKIKGEMFEKPLIKNLRSKEVSYVLQINESAFPAGMNKVQNITFCSKLLVHINSLPKELMLNFQSFSKELTEKFNISNELDFHLVFDYIKHDVYVLENNSKIGCSWESKNFALLKNMCLFKQLI